MVLLGRIYRYGLSEEKVSQITWDIKSNRGPDIQYDFLPTQKKKTPISGKSSISIIAAMNLCPKGALLLPPTIMSSLMSLLTCRRIVNNQDLPLIHFKDFDIGMGNRGNPILFRNCKNLSDANNRIANQIYNNLEMESPKMFVHETSGVDAQRMPNGTTAIEWHGNIKPTIETSSDEYLFDL